MKQFIASLRKFFVHLLGIQYPPKKILFTQRGSTICAYFEEDLKEAKGLEIGPGPGMMVFTDNEHVVRTGTLADWENLKIFTIREVCDLGPYGLHVPYTHGSEYWEKEKGQYNGYIVRKSQIDSKIWQDNQTRTYSPFKEELA